MLQKMSVVPLVVIVILVLALVTLPALNTSLQANTAARSAAAARQPAPSVHTIADSNNIDPSDFCRELNKAFAAAGSPNLCYQSVFIRRSDHIAEVHFTDEKGKLMVRINVGVDDTDLFKDYRLGMPEGKAAYSTTVWVDSQYEGRGIGTIVVRNYTKFLKLLGAQSGDIHLIIASPDINVNPAKQEAWIRFIEQLCVELNGTPLEALKGGCWAVIP